MYTSYTSPSYTSPSNIPTSLGSGGAGRQTYGYRPAQPSPYGQALPPGIMPPPGPPPTSNYVSPLPPGVKPPAGPPPASNYVGQQMPPNGQNAGPKVVHKEEMKLFESTREREEHDNNAELYAIVVAAEHLEKAYVRGIVSDKEYTSACVKLIAQYRTALSLVKDPENFIKTFNLNMYYLH